MKKLFCLFLAAAFAVIAAAGVAAQTTVKEQNSNSSKAQVFSKLGVGKYGIEKIWPSSFSSVNGAVWVEIDNPVQGFMVSDIHGTVYKDGAPFVKGTANNVYVAKGQGKYTVSGNAFLCSGVSLFSLLRLISFDPKQYSVDITVNVKFDDGTSEVLSVSKLPVTELLKIK